MMIHVSDIHVESSQAICDRVLREINSLFCLKKSFEEQLARV